MTQGTRPTTRLRAVRATTRTSKVHDRVKANGVHYTPPSLAAFLASALYRHTALVDAEPIRVLDPACGDGSLLVAFAQLAPPAVRARLQLVGHDTDGAALAKASSSLSHLSVRTDLHKDDFLSLPSSCAQHQGSLFETARQPEQARFDVVIANPPYVRTQVLGAAKAQQLAHIYNLSGRVDLYHAFIRAIAASLRPGGIVGLLTSNRFLYTQAGAATRGALLRDFQLCELFDLGDTKLFSAAVLPAILIARRSLEGHKGECPFARVYEVRGEERPPAKPATYASILDAIESGATDTVAVGATPFRIERGTLALPATKKHSWTLSSAQVDDWLATVAENTLYTFADVAKVRVGIKTTADEVFIRHDWNLLPTDQRPEPELLRPLLRSYMARPWQGATDSANPPRVLYPHRITNGRRAPIDLADFPKARAYLERHRERLTARRYVIEGGRQWYEIWVPQNPADWAKPKIVFPDISEQPRFFLDSEGFVVNGDCYWITLKPGQDPRWLPLMLAVANSTFILKYYDAVFGNKLYAGRRRFITQYVQRFPLPSFDNSATQQLVNLVPELLRLAPASPERENVEAQIDASVWRAFRLVEEVSG